MREPPNCYGKGIYEYWKLKKDSANLIIKGQKEGDPLLTLFGWILTGGLGISDILHGLEGRIDRTLLPKDECIKCPYLKGCFSSAVALIINEIEEELREN